MVVRIDIRTENFEPLARNFRGAEPLTQISINETLREIGRPMVERLKSFTPTRTRKLRNSTRFQVVGGPSGQQLEIRQGARTPSRYGAFFYGRFVRSGTRPHIIRPRFATVLAFQVAGQQRFAKSVQHPGTSPNPYHIRTLNSMRGTIQRIISKRQVSLIARLLDV